MDTAAPDEDLEWAVRLVLEARRRVKEQQKRIGSAEFRNTHFGYFIGDDGVERFVATPELRVDSETGQDPLELGQIWGISEGGFGVDDHASLYRIEITEGQGSGVKVLNNLVPPPFRELKYVGKEEAPEHSILACPEWDGEAALHRFTESAILEGSWKEEYASGMWKMRLTKKLFD